MYILINNQILDEAKAKISVFDHGYMYGLGVFETFRVYNGHPFLLDDHLARLQTGLDEINVKLEINKEEVLNQLAALLNKNQLDHAYVRLNISAGIGELGLQTSPYYDPTVMMYMKPLPSLDDVVEKKGIILKTKRNSPEGEQRIKSHHFLNNILAKREIGSDPYLEGIFLNEHGFVAEGIVSNIFWVNDGEVFTPDIRTGILNGITRQFLMDMITEMGIVVKEGFYATEDLLSADEVFVTNSIQEIVPLEQMGERGLLGKKGRLTAKLIDQYRSYRFTCWGKCDLRGKGRGKW